MKVFGKLVSHAVVFAIGGGVGIWYGVAHPTEAQNIAAHEEKAKAQATIAMIKQFHPDMTATSTVPPEQEKYQQALEKAQKDLDDANQKLAVQP